uniref:Uncharacterized protein n=1 Tax=Arundo donax TaxID=35708 RepID=A0A0A9GPK6_ARUDO
MNHRSYKPPKNHQSI